MCYEHNIQSSVIGGSFVPRAIGALIAPLVRGRLCSFRKVRVLPKRGYLLQQSYLFATVLILSTLQQRNSLARSTNL